MLFYTIFLVAMFTAIVLIPPLTFLYQKLDIVDIPSPRKVHTSPIPRVGGVAIVIATVIPTIRWVELDTPMTGMLLGIAMIFVLGIIDDAKNLSYKIKFIIQIAAVSLIFISGFIDMEVAHFVANNLLNSTWLLLGYFIFVLAVTNAINLADGLDGLAGGEALLSFSIIGLLAYESNNSTIILMVLAIIGAVFGFLRFNTYPAKIFMGDTGSLFLGFVLGVLSVALTYGADNAYAKMLPLLLVGLPVFDTIMVIIIRLYNKQSPFNADRNHLHHKLLDNGFKHYQSVLIIYLMQSVFVLAAYFMRYDTELNVMLAFVAISIFALLIGYSTKHNKSSSSNEFQSLGKLFAFVKSLASANTERLFMILAGLLFLYSMSSSMNIETFDTDILILLSGIVAVGLIGLIVFRNKPCNWVERVAVHVMIVLSIYFGTNSVGSHVDMVQISMLLLCAAIIAVLIFGHSRKKFVGSPLDFLLIATAIVIPNLPNSPISDPSLSVLIIKLIILFYCIEYVLFNVNKNWWAIRSTLVLSACVPIALNFL